MKKVTRKSSEFLRTYSLKSMLNPNLREKILSTVYNERFPYDSLIGGQPVCP
jgi:hypothetical protein